MSAGNVIKLRLLPLIRVERWSVGWLVTVRPCPNDVQSVRSFSDEEEAAAYAAELQRRRGFRVRPERYAVPEPARGA